MKKFGFATIAASGLAAAFFGFAAPAQAATDLAPVPAGTTISTGVDHLGWLNDISPDVKVPSVDNSVRHSGR
jgi:hypothetical protein